MCDVELVLVDGASLWKHSIIYPGFAMYLFTCMAEICLDKAEIVRITAANIPRSPREDGFDQRAIDSIKARMVRLTAFSP